jgi:hypothetical protein
MGWASAGHDEDWRIVEVATLPWPRCLFRCPLHSALQGDIKFMKDLHEAQAATRRLSLSLSGDEVAKCPYHRPDWRLAADTAVALLERTGGLTVEIADQAVRSIEMDDETAWALISLVADPILWGGGDEVANGQHRVCAMKLAGASRCPHVER